MKIEIKHWLFILVFLPMTIAGQTDRELWVKELTKLSRPLLTALSKDQLKQKMPVEQSSFEYGDRSEFAHLEAFGRLMAGIAPWLELGPSDSKEGKLRAEFIKLSHSATANAVDPTAKDFMNFNKGSQPLVDAAFLAQAFIRAPKQLWEPLDAEVKARVIANFKSTRKITPNYSNWLLFSATIEAFLMKFTDEADYMRIDLSIKKHMEWYLGDGMYGDGEKFYWDYYNSFVIQPMLLDIAQVLVEKDPKKHQKLYDEILKRAQRYSVILERMISPEGTYPVIGRSAIYRLASFQTLSQIALKDELSKELSYGQVRSALTAVMKRIFNFKTTYTKDDWLQLGVVGYQPKLAEAYISTGSLYLTSVGFLHLGLKEDHLFWTSKSEPWTMMKMWSGDETLIRDKAIN